LIQLPSAQYLLDNWPEVIMETQATKQSELDTGEYRCIVCGTHLSIETLCCPSCARNGLNSRQYAEFFWDEV
jgi:hypothetical protein